MRAENLNLILCLPPIPLDMITMSGPLLESIFKAGFDFPGPFRVFLV